MIPKEVEIQDTGLWSPWMCGVPQVGLDDPRIAPASFFPQMPGKETVWVLVS
jgi:hypothetical protein